MHKIIAPIIVFVALILSAQSVHAGEVGPLGRVEYQAKVSGSAFTDLAINTAKTTDAIKTDGWNEITVWIEYTYSSAISVNMTCFEKRRFSDEWYAIPMCDDSAPPDSICQLLNKRWPVSADVNWRWRIPIMGRYMQCSFVTTGGGAGDTATVAFVGGHQ